MTSAKQKTISRMFRSIVYLGFALPEKHQRELEQLDASPHFATYNFSWALIRSLEMISNEVSVISSYEIRNFPEVKRVIFRSDASSEAGRSVLVIGFINVLLLKHISRLAQLFLRMSIIRKVAKSELLVVHGTHTPYMVLGVIARVFGKKTLLVLTDQHGFLARRGGAINRALSYLDKRLMRFLIGQFDGYFCLNPAFVSQFCLDRALVRPGIVPLDLVDTDISDGHKARESAMFTVAFAGNISHDNGIDLLLRAFDLLKDAAIRLRIFGIGTEIDRVIEASQKNPNIEYGGAVERKILLRELRSADLLVNPRPAGQEKNLFSFPSKLLEFAALGVATLTAEAINIPDELSDCFLYFKGREPQSLAKAILDASLCSGIEMFGERAKRVVMANYTEARISVQIRDLFSTPP